jgi:hypothetical protein
MASSQGTTVTLNSAAGISVTSVVVDGGQTRRTITAPHLGLGPNDFEPSFNTFKSVTELPTVAVEYIGAALFRTGEGVTVTASGPFSYSGSGTVVSSRLSASVGELIRGSVTVRVG